ncbi:MAG: helix-turn-helix domain-containing protein [Prevotella sp.]|nr:helix-turn-helix domain-containing protein [Prevotella sp.]
METSDLLLEKMLTLTEPVKAACLAEMMEMDRKTIDKALKLLKEDGKIMSPKRGYYECIMHNCVGLLSCCFVVLLNAQTTKR